MRQAERPLYKDMIEPKNPIVAGIADPGNAGAARTEETLTEAAADDSGYKNSKKVYVSGKTHPEIRVPFREISLAPTKTMSGEIEVNEPVRVYDTSGPWGDNARPARTLDPLQGLPPLRAKWIRDRDDVEEHEGRKVQPIDDGYLSVSHAEHAAKRNGRTEQGAGSRGNSELRAPRSKLTTLRAKPGKVVTQLQYARQGIITPEMEFIAIRENLGRESSVAAVYDRRNQGNRRSQSAATEEVARN